MKHRKIIPGGIRHEECAALIGYAVQSHLARHELVQVDDGLRPDPVGAEWLVSTHAQLFGYGLEPSRQAQDLNRRRRHWSLIGWP